MPANRPDRFEKAARSGADPIVLDLEDSVPAAEKGQARQKVFDQVQKVATVGVPLVVRINVSDSGPSSDDFATVAELNALVAVMVIAQN